MSTLDSLQLLKCPLSGKIMFDPVFYNPDGETYEREAVIDYIKKNGVSPKGNPGPSNFNTVLSEDKRTKKFILNILKKQEKFWKYVYSPNSQAVKVIKCVKGGLSEDLERLFENDPRLINQNYEVSGRKSVSLLEIILMKGHTSDDIFKCVINEIQKQDVSVNVKTLFLKVMELYSLDTVIFFASTYHLDSAYVKKTVLMNPHGKKSKTVAKNMIRLLCGEYKIAFDDITVDAGGNEGGNGGGGKKSLFQYALEQNALYLVEAIFETQPELVVLKLLNSPFSDAESRLEILPIHYYAERFFQEPLFVYLVDYLVKNGGKYFKNQEGGKTLNQNDVHLKRLHYSFAKNGKVRGTELLLERRISPRVSWNARFPVVSCFKVAEKAQHVQIVQLLQRYAVSERMSPILDPLKSEIRDVRSENRALRKLVGEVRGENDNLRKLVGDVVLRMAALESRCDEYDRMFKSLQRQSTLPSQHQGGREPINGQTSQNNGGSEMQMAELSILSVPPMTPMTPITPEIQQRPTTPQQQDSVDGNNNDTSAREMEDQVSVSVSVPVPVNKSKKSKYDVFIPSSSGGQRQHDNETTGSSERNNRLYRKHRRDDESTPMNSKEKPPQKNTPKRNSEKAVRTKLSGYDVFIGTPENESPPEKKKKKSRQYDVFIPDVKQEHTQLQDASSSAANKNNEPEEEMEVPDNDSWLDPSIPDDDLHKYDVISSSDNVKKKKEEEPNVESEPVKVGESSSGSNTGIMADTPSVNRNEPRVFFDVNRTVYVSKECDCGFGYIKLYLEHECGKVAKILGCHVKNYFAVEFTQVRSAKVALKLQRPALKWGNLNGRIYIASPTDESGISEIMKSFRMEDKLFYRFLSQSVYLCPTAGLSESDVRQFFSSSSSSGADGDKNGLEIMDISLSPYGYCSVEFRDHATAKNALRKNLRVFGGRRIMVAGNAGLELKMRKMLYIGGIDRIFTKATFTDALDRDLGIGRSSHIDFKQGFAFVSFERMEDLKKCLSLNGLLPSPTPSTTTSGKQKGSINMNIRPFDIYPQVDLPPPTNEYEVTIRGVPRSMGKLAVKKLVARCGGCVVRIIRPLAHPDVRVIMFSSRFAAKNCVRILHRQTVPYGPKMAGKFATLSVEMMNKK